MPVCREAAGGGGADQGQVSGQNSGARCWRLRVVQGLSTPHPFGILSSAVIVIHWLLVGLMKAACGLTANIVTAGHC